MGLFGNAKDKLFVSTEGLNSVQDKTSFLWGIIESELKKQSITELIDLRRRLNKVIQDKFREEDKKKKVEGVDC